MHRKTIRSLLSLLFVLSLVTASFAVSAPLQNPPLPGTVFTAKKVAMEATLEAVKREIGGVPLSGFYLTEEDLDFKGNTLSYSGEFAKAGAMDLAALGTVQRRFATVINRAYGLGSYDLDLDYDSLDISFEQIRDVVTVSDGVYGLREYVPYVSVTVSMTAEEEEEEGLAGYTELEYNIYVALERRVIRLNVGQANAKVNGAARKMRVPPFVENGRTLVPLRFLGEQLEAVFDWDHKEKKITIVRGDIRVELHLGDDEARIYLRGAIPQTVALGAPAVLVRGQIMVPLRFAGESLGADVRWNQTDRSIIVRD